jgi:hypothetical protein
LAERHAREGVDDRAAAGTEKPDGVEVHADRLRLLRCARGPCRAAQRERHEQERERLTSPAKR